MGVLVDSDLVARVVELSGERTKKAAVTKALEEFISLRADPKQRELLNKSRWRRTPQTNEKRRQR